MSGVLPFDPIAEASRKWREHGWAEYAAGMAAVTSVMRAQQILTARVDAELRPMGLSFARYEVLMLLVFSREGRLPMRVIGNRLQVHPTSVTNAVDRLEMDDLVRRQPHPNDRRAVLVALTDAGRGCADLATERLNHAVFADLGLGAGQERTLTAVLADLRRGAGDF